MTLVIAGERSGVGKTTVTLALLSSLKRRQLKVQSFKVGPDYIDPMFHQYVTGVPCRNLDPVLTSESYVRQCFNRHVQNADYALIEGVMGLFDGVKGNGKWAMGNSKENRFPVAFASTAHIARLLDLPVILVIDCRSVSGSVAALAHGYRSFDPRVKLAGVVLNRVGSDRHLELLKDALEPLELPVLGVLRRQDEIVIPDRHLGLVPTAELSQIDTLIARLADLGNSCFDWERLLPLLEIHPSPITHHLSPITHHRVKIGVARDRAFSFYYQDNLDLLQSLGAELVFWSPLTNSDLPEGVQGLYLGGGFPEVFARQLAENHVMRDAVRSAILTGMPTYAECGGLMYLCREIVDFDRKSWEMVGVLQTTAVMGQKLTLGYRQATALQESSLLATGETVWGHEFHRSSLSEMPTKPLFQIRGDNLQNPTEEGWQKYRVHASYVHLLWGDRLELPARFLQHCAEFNS